MDNNNNNNNNNDDGNINSDNDDDYDEAPTYIDMNDVVEVGNDEDAMEEEASPDAMGDERTNDRRELEEEATMKEPIVDMSQIQIYSHTDAVYAVAANVINGTLMVLSGGGDDKAFLHRCTSLAGTTLTTPTTTHTATSQKLAYEHTDTVSTVAFNFDYVSQDLSKTPRLVAVGSYDGSILLYSVDNFEQTLKLEGPSDVEWLAFHPKGGSVLLAGSGDGTVWMFHIPLNRCLQVFVGHEQAVTAGCFSPDGKWALSASSDGTLRIWAPKTGMNKHVFRTGEAGLTCLASNGGSDGMLVLVGGEDGQAHVCHIGTKKIVASLRHYEVPQNAQTLAASAAAMNTNEEGEEDMEMEYPMSVEAVGFFPAQPNWCATGGIDGKLKIWDLANDGQCRQVCTPPPSTESQQNEKEEEEGPDSITQLQWHPSLPLVFTTSISGTIRLWDARTGGLLSTITGHMDVINGLDIRFHDDGRAVIVTASDDKTIRIFEVNVNAALASQQQQQQQQQQQP